MNQAEVKELINCWFFENFYNKGLSTELFNLALQARDDLMNRADKAFAAAPTIPQEV